MASGVAAGDVLYVSGIGEFIVSSVTDAGELEITTTFPSTFSGKNYRICRGKIDAADVIYAGPDNGRDNKWAVIWDADTFGIG